MRPVVQPRQRGHGPLAQTFHLPAPVGGLNLVAPASALPPGDCLQLWNLIPGDSGLLVRPGSREWATGLQGVGFDAEGALLPGEVLSLLPYAGSASYGTADKLFAVTPSGIWDVSASGAVDDVDQLVAFDATGGEAGRGEATGMVTAAGHFLVYCDEANGLFIYSESSGWARAVGGAEPGQFKAGSGSTPSSIDPAAFVFPLVWKKRLWLVERDSARAWYAEDAGSLYGNFFPFNFGEQFAKGGHLVGLWSLSFDAGAGIDDHLVAISSGGDVVIYEGTDPSSAETFGIRAVWDAGGLPFGRRIASTGGGDVLLLTKSGLRALSMLTKGGEGQGTYLTAKVSPLVNALMLTKSGLPGWSIHLHPEVGALMVTVPTDPGQPVQQLVLPLAPGRGWGRWRDLPMTCATTWQGKLYFGTADGRVLVNDGWVDGVSLTDPDAYDEVEWSVLQPLPSSGQQTRILDIRPRFLSGELVPAFEAEARYGGDQTEIATTPAGEASANAWDVGEWDEAVWGDEHAASQPLRGAAGIGIDGAIAIKGSAKSRTVLVGTDVRVMVGGWL